MPQALVSTTWSFGGPFATAPAAQSHNGASCKVLVFHGDVNSSYFVSELRHPMPVSMIQWRPSLAKQSKENSWNHLRLALLTCCEDGTVRLWSEIDDGKVRKTDQRTKELCFRVAAIIEINQAVNGIIGSDVFVSWATELDGIVNSGKDYQYFPPAEYQQHHKTGSCDWVIAVGPQKLVTFWAVHCLDDFSPIRFPRVTLWKRQELLDSGPSDTLLHKVTISRNQAFGPPLVCSLIQLLPCNSLAWSHLNFRALSFVEDGSLNNPNAETVHTCCDIENLSIDGHTGKVSQVAVHSYGCEVEMVSSLDTHGSVLFWSLSDCILGLPTLHPTFKLIGKVAAPDPQSKYTSLSWAPEVINDYRVLLAGHAGGVDCCVVKLCENGDQKIICKRLGTIPFTGNCDGVGPSRVCSAPLTTTNFACSSFMLLATWKNGFRALSWKISIYPCDSSGRCCEDSVLAFETDIGSKAFCFCVYPCSSKFPDPYNHGEVTCFAVLGSSNFVLAEKQKGVICYPYNIVTGCPDGSLKLWRILENPEWELVGMLEAQEGPITLVASSDCGRKIVTASPADLPNASCILMIWESMHLSGAGTFLIEETLILEKEVVALHWMAMGNGQLLLGVGMENELQVYASRRCGGQNLLEPERTSDKSIWFCVASTRTHPSIRDFFWGPKATVILVHDDYFCLFSHWVLPGEKNCLAKEVPLNHNGAFDENVRAKVPTYSDIGSFKKLTLNDDDEWVKMNVLSASPSTFERFKSYHNTIAEFGFWTILEVVEEFGGSLPVYHPEALLNNISSGNWKRSYLALRHLTEHLNSYSLSPRKSFSTKSSHVFPTFNLSNYLEGITSSNSSDKAFKWSGDVTFSTYTSQLQNNLSNPSHWDSSPSTNLLNSSTRSELGGLVESLEKLSDLAAITNDQKLQILSIVDLLDKVTNPSSASHFGSLDEPGRRFWVGVRFQELYYSRRLGTLPSKGDLFVSSEQAGWAFHSDCQESLFSSVLTTEASWQEMRNMGVGYWYTNAAQLRSKMEKLAKQQYLKSKDPKASALLYIALNRIQVLAGLFKISKDEKDKPLVGFLSRNFQEDKNKAAALKNAYVLMGRHQLELAVAFFLLGGDAASAINVCAKNLGDEQLALVICRLVEGCGGPLEHDLISKYLLPAAIGKGDYWLASILEWVLGNHLKAFMSMLGRPKDSLLKNNSAFLSSEAPFLDPNIGKYCLMLASKNSMKNSVGEHNAVILSRLAILMSSTALNRCGLPLEALESLSSSLSLFDGLNGGSESEMSTAERLDERLYPLPNISSNWISGDVALCMGVSAKLDLAMKYFSSLLREHPSWREPIPRSCGALGFSQSGTSQQWKMSLSSFHDKLTSDIAYFEQKFSLMPFRLINMILISLFNNGKMFIGRDILQCYTSKHISGARSNLSDGIILFPSLQKLLFKATEGLSFIFSSYVVACSVSCSHVLLCSVENGPYLQGLLLSLSNFRAALRLSNLYAEDFITAPLLILDLYEFLVLFVSAWFQNNSKALLYILKSPLVVDSSDDSSETKMENLNEFLSQILEFLAFSKPTVIKQKNCGGRDVIPEDERWEIIRAALCGLVTRFVTYAVNSLPEKHEDGDTGSISSLSSGSLWSGCNGNNAEQIQLISASLAKLVMMISQGISSYTAEQLFSVLLRRTWGQSTAPSLLWLDKLSQVQPGDHCKHLRQEFDRLSTSYDDNESPSCVLLWDMFADPKICCGGLVQEFSKVSQCIKRKQCREWIDAFGGIAEENGDDGFSVQDEKLPDNHTSLSSGNKDLNLKGKYVPFKNPKELCKRNGELLEAMCVNSIDRQQAAIASNKKGIIFFYWDDGWPAVDKSDYIWSDAEWPHGGWAGSESTPVPTCVSPGVGLGRKRGSHLGLGGATIGVGTDFTGGGAFGVSGYAGVGASGLGWEVQEDFEELVDPPATVENITTRSFSSHPSRPFFLVGSSNTHTYLWEFGKDRAIATYGVLPAANVPPPYALASISALQFDHCGQRFVTAASDGTVCTWQLEVGGRSNIHPTESSHCFNNYTSDVMYVTASGSIIAATGYSSDNVNVVVWDTLAPPTTSRASIMCHEGGARSLSVLSHAVGSGSVSPFIVTGGKGGDVGVHDFRYIATGRSKRHRHSDSGEQHSASSTAGLLNKHGDQNRNGMLWYIPKAHSGSVTTINAIPNTSFFLTGSKDGDVKLWDARRASLVFHWPKLHDRHTFIQPSSRGFGGVVRAAVTRIQVVSNGFLSCGGDGTVKLVQLKDS